ncbi:MAG: glycosyltransferase family 39 protein [Chloroflexota bacterium]
MRDSRLKWGLIFLFVLWLFYGLSAYYVVQKPFSVPQLVALLENPSAWLTMDFAWSSVGRSLLDVGTAVLINLAAWGIGATILSYVKLEMDGLATPALSGAEVAVFGTGLGFGILGLWIFLLGLIGAFTPTAFWGTMGVTLALTLWQIIFNAKAQRRKENKTNPCQSAKSAAFFPTRGITIYLLIVLGLALTLALLPPTDWDGLFYHLKGPKLYLEAGRIIGGIDIPHLSFPALFEMLFTLAMGLRGDVAAKLLHFSFIPWLMALVYLISTRFFATESVAVAGVPTVPQSAGTQKRQSGGWTAVLVLISMPMVLNLGAQAYNDLPLAFYQVAALIAILRWRQHEQTGWLVLSGVFAGLAMGLKYTSFATPLLLAGTVLWHFWQKDIGAAASVPAVPPGGTAGTPAAAQTYSSRLRALQSKIHSSH